MLFLICIVVPMILTFMYSYHHVGKQLDEQNFGRLFQQVRTTSHSIYERLLFLRAELNLLSSRLPPDAKSPEDFTVHVEKFFENQEYERFGGILFLKDASPIPVYGRINVPPKLEEKENEALKEGRTVLLKEDSSTDFPSIFMAVPLASGSTGKGLLIGEISPEYLWGVGPMGGLPPMTDLVVLDSDRRPLIASLTIAEEFDGLFSRMDSGECADRIYWNHGGNEHVAACRMLFLEGQFSATGWTIVLSQSQHDIRTSLKDFKIIFPLFSLLGLLVALLASTITIRRSIQPLKELRKATRTIASGDFDAKAAISSGDEFEELAEDFNRMGAQLRNQFGNLRLTAEIGRHMATTMDAPKLAERVLESICRHLDFDAAFLCWHAPESPTFIGTGSYRLTPEQCRELIRQWQSSWQKEKHSEMSAEYDLIADASHVASVVGARSAICLPLGFADQLTGILVVFKSGSVPVAENSGGILNAIANELSVSLSNIHSLNRFVESEKKFRSIFEKSAAGVALLDAQGRFAMVNRSLCRMTGYSEEELCRKTSMELLSPQSGPVVSKVYRELQSGERDSGFLEESYIRKDGRTVWGMASHSLLRDMDGNPMYYVDLIQDITELKQMREENEALERQLRQAQKMEAIGTLAGGIAHDFNNILMAIIGYTELALMYTREEDPLRKMLDRALNGANRAADLVGQILTFSRQNPQEKRAILPTPLVKEALKLIRATFPARIQIEEIYENDFKKVLADPTQIHQVVMNLCTNAYHAMQENDSGLLRVEVKSEAFLSGRLAWKSPDARAENSGEWLKISVSDSGCGIHPDNLQRIFEPYFTTKPVGEGTGLGLSVVHGIMKESGGLIDVESRLGEGTTIGLFFPVCQGSGDSAQKEDSVAIPSGKERLMFIDDEDSILDVGKKMLESLGYQVETFGDPKKAIECFRTRPHDFDLVITDESMPRMNGRAVAADLVAIRRDLPILIASGYPGNGSQNDNTAGNGRLKLIKKPLGIADLAKAVRNLLDMFERDAEGEGVLTFEGSVDD